MRFFKYILILACFIPILLFRDFTPNNELKYLSVADEALRDGHFFTFWNHGIIYADKPPLYLWIVMLGKWLFGTHSMLFLGLFSLLPALIILYVMDKWVEKFLPFAFRNSAQLMLITSGLFLGSAIVLRMDMLMCLFIVLALYTFFRLYTGCNYRYDSILLPVYIFLAIFSKGPVGILVPLFSIIVFLILQKQLRLFPMYLGWKQWGILLGLCAIWFGCVYAEGGKAYLNNLLFNQTVNRAVDSFHHKEPIWYYLKTIWYSLAPWILFYLATIWMGIKKHLINNNLKKFFLTVITTTFVALSLFSGKLDIYMLPIFPFVAYLSFLLLPNLTSPRLRFTIGVPAGILSLSFPALWIAVEYFPLALVPFSTFPIFLSAFILSTSAMLCLWFLLRKQLLASTNSLSIGLFLTILIASFSISELNSHLGWQKISQKAITVAQKNNIKDYYFYKFRSGENLDVYLNQKIYCLHSEDLPLLLGKQNFILFVKNKDIVRDKELHNLCQDKEFYTIGNYSIIIF